MLSEVIVPNFTVPIANTYDAITRPISVMLAKEVMRICMIDENTPLRIAGERGVTNQPSSDLYKQDEIRYGANEVVYCTVEETVRNNQLLASPIRTNDQTPVIVDAGLGLVIRPVYLQHDLKLEFKYRARSKHAAERWKNELAVRIAESRAAMQHTFLYNLTLNEGLLGLLQHIYTLRENVSGYGDTFAQWFSAIQVREFHVAGTLDGDITKSSIQLGERQAHILGHFEPSDIPKETADQDTTIWEVDYVYNVSYMKPVHWYVVYPIFIHQQHIGTDYIDMTPKYSVDDLDQTLASRSWNALERIRWSVHGRAPQPEGGLRYPYYDDWFVPEDTANYSVPIISWLIALEPLQPQYVVDLKDLPDMDFTDTFTAYLKANVSGLTQRGRAMVKFTLYEGNTALADHYLTIDADLNVRTTEPLSMRKMYHLRMSFITSMIGTSSDVRETLMDHPVAALEMFQTIFPMLDVEWAWRNAITIKQRLDERYLEWMLLTLEQKKIGHRLDRIPALKRKVFLNPIPEIQPTLEQPMSRYRPVPIGPKDPGTFSGRNTPDPTPKLIPPFALDDEEDVEDNGYLGKPMTPTYTNDLPMLNNRRAMQTVQYLAIFAHKRKE